MTAGGFDEVHEELRAVARELLGKSGAGRAPAWGQLADVGWLGLEVPEDLGGAGATIAEVAVVLEELGRAAAAGPYLGTTVLGVGMLNLLQPGRGRDGLLRLVAQGDRTVAIALAGDSFARTGFRLEDGRLTGQAAFVLDATGADRLLVPADDADGGPVVVVLHTGAEAPPGLSVTAQPVLDATRSLGTVTADSIAIDSHAIWRFRADADAAITQIADRAALAVAVDALGVGAAMLDATVAYAKVRHQFGRPIGSFQAVKHACADMLVQLTIARQLVAEAVLAVAAADAPGADAPGPAAQAALAQAPGTEVSGARASGAKAPSPMGQAFGAQVAGGDVAGAQVAARAVPAEGSEPRASGADPFGVEAAGAGLAVARAKAAAGEAAVAIVGKALQLHGGIGYTWESGIHTFLKRAALDRALFGDPAVHRRRIAGHLAVAPAGPGC